MIHERTTRLLDFMEQHQLSITDVSKMLGRSNQTVRIWRSDNARKQVIPEHSFRLLELTVAAAKQ
jgi:excinuclease UvrABC helicase subunit UvrB